jgi:uncharacterized damage-inducible protein DinB
MSGEGDGRSSDRDRKRLARRAEIVHPGRMTDDTSPAGHPTDTGLREAGVTRNFGWSNMFVRPEDDPRTEGGFDDERALLVGYLHDYRLTIELKCSGLGAVDMARRSVEPSNLSLLGLVRHLADVERHWFRRVLDGQDVPSLYQHDDDRDAAFNGAVGDREAVESAWAAWREEVRFAERFVEEAPNLELAGSYDKGRVISLREVLVHMIEEYARHAGHADLLRERIDGRVGQ